jgi:ATP-dependent exoDNAse (exonuclease V) alpha subunit
VDKELAMRIITDTESRLSAAGVASGGKPFALRDFQLRAVLQAACGDGQLCVQIAGAGMGKTTSAQFIKEILTAQGRHILGVAPSNKAASGLGRELGIATSSIDRLLLDLQAGRQALDRNTVVFVDEAGMAGFDVMEKLFELAAQSGAKLILTGDPEQLPAVARGNVLRKLTQMEALTSSADALMYLGRNLADWNRISRQKHDWAKQASMYFSQGYVGEGLREYESRNCVHGAMTATHLGEDIAQAYLQDPAVPAQKLILATTNAQVKALNAVVRDRLKAAGKLHGAWKLPDTGMELSLGDRLVFKERQPIEQNATQAKKPKDAKKAKPALRANIAKNEFATVMAITRQPDGSLDLLCQLDTPKDDGTPNLVRLNSRAMGEIDHAFATTVHRSQGMTVDSVFAVPGTFLSKELFYVMATRHRERLNIHMLESDRATLLAKASQNMTKLHAWDLTDAQRAGGQPTSGILVRLQASTDRLFALMQRERARFEAVIGGSVRTAIQLPLVQAGMRSIREVGSTLEGILSCASAVQRDVVNLVGGACNQGQPKHQAGRKAQPEHLAQSR